MGQGRHTLRSVSDPVYPREEGSEERKEKREGNEKREGGEEKGEGKKWSGKGILAIPNTNPTLFPAPLITPNK